MFRVIEDGFAELVGVTGRAPTPDEARAGFRAAKHAGFRVIRERKSGQRQGLREITRERV